MTKTKTLHVSIMYMGEKKPYVSIVQMSKTKPTSLFYEKSKNASRFNSVHERNKKYFTFR